MSNFRVHLGPHSRSRSGQTFLLVVVFVAIFLAAVLGLSTDFSQAWAHRQMAQAAADAACQAGAADLYLKVVNSSITGLDYIGTDYDCSTNTSSAPCQYASLNGYSGSKVAVSFPSSVSGAPSLSGYTITNAYITVAVSDPVPLSFSKILFNASTINMSAKASCGLVKVDTHIPLLVLHPSNSGALTRNGGASVTIIGGATRSIQVNSKDTGAVQPSGGGGSGIIDLSKGGPNDNGGDFGVFGAEADPGYISWGTKPGKWYEKSLPWSDPFAGVAEPSAPSAASAHFVGFGWEGCPDPKGCVEYTAGNYVGCTNTGNFSTDNGGFKGGTSGQGCLIVPTGFGFSIPQWAASTSYTAGQIVVPSTNNAGGYMFQALNSGTTSGSAPSGWSQTTFGTFTEGSPSITWRNIGLTCSNVNNCKVNSVSSAIFDPGVYYVGTRGLQLNSGSTARQSYALGDGSYGTTFYFSASSSGSNPATVSVGSAAGNQTGCTPPAYSSCIASYKPDGSDQTFGTAPNTVTVQSAKMACLGTTSVPALPTQVPATINGNILMGPCTGTYRGGESKNDGSGGTDRGFLFFQGRSTTSIQAKWGGGGDFALSGFMYFHNQNDYSTQFNMSGNPGSTAMALGDIVADQVTFSGTANLTMLLNPNVSFPVLAPQLLQ